MRCGSDRSDPRWNAKKDCAGICFGGAVIDKCQVCAGGRTGIQVPSLLKHIHTCYCIGTILA